METSNTKRENGLTANSIKFIAIIAMTIDHFTWTFFPGYRTDVLPLVLHIIGRLTAPIMCYFVVEGYYHTKNLKKYIIRMFAFAFISHFAYALLFGKNFIPFKNSVFDQTSVMWTFALGLAALAVSKSANPKLKPWLKQVIIWICLIAAFCADWSTPAAVSILYMGMNRGNFKKQMLWFMLWIVTYSIVYAVFLDFVYGLIQVTVAFAIPILYQYNGSRGKWKEMKWLFYIYYPLHLTIFGIIRICMTAI
jgi:hypothetical protein